MVFFFRGMELSAGSYSFSGSFGAVLAGTVSTRHEGSILSEVLRTQSLRNELMGLRAETLRNELINTDCLNNDLITESLKLMKPGYLTNQLTKHDGFMNELVRAESLRNEGIQGETATNEPLYTFMGIYPHRQVYFPIAFIFFFSQHCYTYSMAHVTFSSSTLFGWLDTHRK